MMVGMDMQEVIRDIENRNNRMLAAIERWLAADSRRSLKVTFGETLWAVALLYRPGVIACIWNKPTMIDALSHAATFCQDYEEE